MGVESGHGGGPTFELERLARVPGDEGAARDELRERGARVRRALEGE